MKKMKPEHQKTLIQTIKARLERNDEGNVEVIFDPSGPYEICKRTSSGLVSYFTPAYQQGIDKYGNKKDEPNH